MYSIMLFLSMLVCLSSNKVSGQSPSKSEYPALRGSSDRDTSDVRERKQLAAAKLYSVKQFVEYYVKVGKRDSSGNGGRSTIKQLYKDSSFTYFARQGSSRLKHFLRVKSEELRDVNYNDFDGETLREKFFETVIPSSDKQSVEQKKNDNMMAFSYKNFKYDYDQGTKLLKVIFKWKVRSDFMSVINKTYTAQYNVSTGQFVK